MHRNHVDNYLKCVLKPNSNILESKFVTQNLAQRTNKSESQKPVQLQQMRQQQLQKLKATELHKQQQQQQHQRKLLQLRQKQHRKLQQPQSQSQPQPLPQPLKQNASLPPVARIVKPPIDYKVIVHWTRSENKKYTSIKLLPPW